jgi:hypothetical protein
VGKPAQDDEIFQLLRWTWNVSRGWALAGDREPIDMPVAALAGLLALIRVSKAHVANVDVTKPLLAAPYPGDTSVNVIIDGYHRIARAVEDELETLPVVGLTHDEAKEIML